MASASAPFASSSSVALILTFKKATPDSLPAAYAMAAIPARYAVERRNWAEAAKLELPPAACSDWHSVPRRPCGPGANAGDGFAASGTLTTGDTPDANGFFSIIGISGSRNGEAIVTLQPTGTAIPGNQDFPVDNLITHVTPDLISSVFGYQLANGTFVNAFFADFLYARQKVWEALGCLVSTKRFRG